MRDYIDLDCVPYDEECIPAGQAGCARETRTYRDQLWRMLCAEFGEENIRVSVKVALNAHDLADYHSVRVIYNDLDETAVEQAYWLDNNIPAKWDAVAQAKIRENKIAQAQEGDA